MLAFKVPVESQHKNQDRDAQESCAERFANVAEGMLIGFAGYKDIQDR